MQYAITKQESNLDEMSVGRRKRLVCADLRRRIAAIPCVNRSVPDKDNVDRLARELKIRLAAISVQLEEVVDADSGLVEVRTSYEETRIVPVYTEDDTGRPRVGCYYRIRTASALEN